MIVDAASAENEILVQLKTGKVIVEGVDGSNPRVLDTRDLPIADVASNGRFVDLLVRPTAESGHGCVAICP